ncbi:MAG: UvrB/UvrC motif-containing protein [Opitutaceae bacterium]
MKYDIGDLLKDWPASDTENVRKITDANGVEKIQVRVDQGAFQGILQMNLDGRPDGRRPHRRDFVLDHFKDRLAHHLSQSGNDDAFTLSEADCAELFNESYRIYQRYVFLLQVEDYPRVVRDTERNMEVFRFVNRYADRQEDRMHLERWWPYIIRINATATAHLHLDNDDFDRALLTVVTAEKRIRSLDPVDAEEFELEKKRSLEALAALALEIEAKRPLTRTEQLESAMADAVAREDYETAARLRDQLSNLNASRSIDGTH